MSYPRGVARSALLLAGSLALSPLAPSSAADAQPVRSLNPASGALSEEFTRIGTLRELDDGRVLIVDEGDNRLVIADLGRDVVRPLGRVGKGPGEFTQAGRLVALRADTTLLVDVGDRRWLMLAGDSIVATWGPTDPLVAAAAGALIGADTLGRIHASQPLPFAELGAGRRRIQRLHLLIHRQDLRADTIGEVRGFTLASSESVVGTTRRVATFQLVFSVADQAQLFPDGWLAIARQAPYHVEWRDPAGAITRGRTIPYTAVRVDGAEKERWADGIRRDNPGAAIDVSTVMFADELPPFTSIALVALPDGRLAIRRHPSRREPGVEYDIVDRAGARVQRLVLPAESRIVGSGRASIYVATKDEDGIERVARHP